MNKKEAEERVEKIKKLLKDYQELAPLIGIDEKTQTKTIDMFLDDLSEALKEAKKVINLFPSKEGGLKDNFYGH